MNNKETLKSYNNKLIKNNDNLQTVINMVNNLPDVGDGPSEDLTEEMASYDEKLTTQETTLSDIVSALKFKAKPETGDEPEEKNYVYLIKDGVEQTDITGGYTITRMRDGEGTNTIINGDGFIGLCGQVWSYWSMQFNNKIDFAKYPKLYVEYAYPLSSTPYASGYVEFAIYDVYEAKEHMLIKGTGVKERTTDIIDFSDTGTSGALQIRFGNNGDGSNYTRYPIQIFNLYLEEDPRPLQNKSVEIVENKYTEVTADEGYFGLNKVKITTMVSTGGYENILDNTDYSLGQWNIGSNGSLTPGNANNIYRFNKLIPVIGGETLYLSKGLVLHYNITDTSLNYDTTGRKVITVPTGATMLGVRTFAADTANFNPDDYIISRTPITEGGGSSGEIFSTEEIMTNKKWIDGKPIYRKVFTKPVPTITHGYEKYTAIKIDISDINYDIIVDFSGTIEQANHDRVFWGLNWYNYIAGASAITNILGSEECIQIRLNSNWLTNGSIIVILEYTKRTN